MDSADDMVIEQQALRAWPATVVKEAQGWVLRSTPGVARSRSNRALPPRCGALDGLSAVQKFYGRRNLPVLIQVSPAHRHLALDDHLAARGFERLSPTLVMRAPLTEETGRRRGRGVGGAERQVRLGARDEAWTRTLQSVDGRRDAAGELVMDRIPAHTVFARVLDEDDEDEVAGVGAGVVDREWLGVFCMGTRPEYRRGGVATAILRSLLTWGRGHGARSAWLQVEEENTAARKLYEAYGFVESHRYHYRRSTG
ncbi:ribosomal protein S18 acetylase RimI-like enzyme [Nocardiopsis mwathae]|uniref:Ribosomal protein S18 acetylase RimI-like enzyme n=1 Tax=Nocardiopsis mwathae TaxID=1472723 RepID=A0A7W9YE21_9ACTN|nr:GNAT family N-acetyltransferase [Nocardiopsis mwathae]MBB6170397.1 ribosomal protein S18 acetylase RimI-like enzyme [Nocardiopsis mwathae]